MSRLPHVQFDRFAAGEGRLLHVWRDTHRIFFRHDLLRKFPGSVFENEGFFGGHANDEAKRNRRATKGAGAEHPPTRRVSASYSITRTRTNNPSPTCGPLMT